MSELAKYFAPQLKGWRVTDYGSKPTTAMFDVVAGLGKRQGVEALYLAMCLRPQGCTKRQYMLASGAEGAANNTRKSYIDRGWFTGSVVSGSKPFAHTLTLTAKGKAAIAANAKAAASDGKAKARKAKADGDSKAVKARKARKAAPRKPRQPKAPAPHVEAPAPGNGQPTA